MLEILWWNVNSLKIGKDEKQSNLLGIYHHQHHCPSPLATNKHPLTTSIPSRLSEVTSRVSICFHIHFTASSPCNSWPSPSPLPLRVPSQCLSYNVLIISTKCGTNPTPTSSTYLIHHWYMSRPFPDYFISYSLSLSMVSSESSASINGHKSAVSWNNSLLFSTSHNSQP